MKTFLTLVLLLALLGVARADQCAYVTQRQAELAATLLSINPNYISYCELCKDASGKAIHVTSAIAKPVGEQEYWGLFADGKNVDLAYAYIDIGETKAVNMARLTGCPVTKTPGLIDTSTESRFDTPTGKQEVEASPESQLVAKADEYFQYSEFAGAVKLYEQAARSNPDLELKLRDKIIKCYYNLGVITIRQKNCNMALDYFRQVMFIDDKDSPARDALDLARRCQKEGPTASVLKSIAFLELRK